MRESYCFVPDLHENFICPQCNNSYHKVQGIVESFNGGDPVIKLYCIFCEELLWQDKWVQVEDGLKYVVKSFPSNDGRLTIAVRA